MKRILLLALLLGLFIPATAFAVKAGYGNLPGMIENLHNNITTTHGHIQSNNIAHVGIDLRVKEGDELYAPFSGTVYYVQVYGQWLNMGNRLLSYGNMALLLSDEIGTNNAGEPLPGTHRYALKLCHLQRFPEAYNQYKLPREILPIEDGQLGRSKNWGHSELVFQYHSVGQGFHIETGDLVGYAGGTGNSSGVHCHVEMNLDAKFTNAEQLKVSGTSVDPAAYFARDKYALDYANKLNGQLDMAYTMNGNLRVMGWAERERKPEEAVQLEAHVNIGNFQGVNLFSTNQYRGDIANGVGSHGFDKTCQLNAFGTGTVALYMKKPNGSLVQIGDRAYNIHNENTNKQIAIEGKQLGYYPGDTFKGTWLFGCNQEDFAHWAQTMTYGITSRIKNSYAIVNDVDFVLIRWYMHEGSVLYMKDGRTIVCLSQDDSFVSFMMLSDTGVIEQYTVSWELLPIFLNNMHGGIRTVEYWDHTGVPLMEGECTVTSPCPGGVKVSGWVSTEGEDRNVDIVVDIGGTCTTMSTSPKDGVNSFGWLFSTNTSGATRVTVTARNSGNTKTLFDGTVQIASDSVNRDCIICIDSPRGNYNWDDLPEITGWIATHSAITGLTAAGIPGLADIDLMPTLRDASYELNNAGYGAYAYKRRFSYRFTRDQFIPSGMQTLRVQATFADGSRSEPVSTTFSQNALIIYDGTNMCTWFSGTPGGGEQNSFDMDEPVYVCYRLTSVEKGWGIDAAHPEYAYSVHVSVQLPNGATRSYEFSNDENWLMLPTDMAGDYTIVISVTGDAHVNPQTLSLNVPVTIKPSTRLWWAWNGNDPETLTYASDVGGTYYGCYQLLDEETGLPVNQAAGYYDYTVTMALVNSNGEVTDSRTFYNADSGSFPYTLREEDSYSLRLTASGMIGGMDACAYNRSFGFTAYSFTRSVSLYRYINDYTKLYPYSEEWEIGVPRVYCVYKQGWTGNNFDYRFVQDNDKVRCVWVSGLNRKDSNRMLQITPMAERLSTITLELYDRASGQVYASCRFYVTGKVPTYEITYDANGGSDAPDVTVKRKGEARKLSIRRVTPPDEDTLFRGWSTDPNAQLPEYLPGDWYTIDAPVTLYAVWEHGDRYTYDLNGGKNGPESMWHSELLEARPFRLASEQPTRLGYIFQGWSLSPSATTASYSAGDVCNQRGSHIFYAVWKRDPSMLDFGNLSDSVEWVLEANNVLSIRGSGPMPSASYDDAHPWSEHTIHTVIVENGITKIGRCAFQNMEALTDVTLPSTLTQIDSYAFSGCKALPKIRIPNSVTSLGMDAFACCEAFKSFVIGGNVTYVGSGLLRGCTGIEEVRLGAGMSCLPSSMLQACTSLTDLTVPGHITRIDEYAFMYCTALERVTFMPGVQSLGNNAFYGATALTSVTLPESMTSIGQNAFCDCVSLSSLRLPGRITVIPNQMLNGCAALREVNIPNGVTSIGNNAFHGCKALCELELPEGVVSLGEGALSACAALMRMTLPASVQRVGRGCFNSDTTLRGVIVLSADTQFEIGDYSGIFFYGVPGGAFEQFCSNNGLSFRSITYGDAAWEVEDGVITAYNGVGGDVTVPASLGATAIGNGAFQGCPVTSITLPASITAIGQNAFRDCSLLSSVSFQGDGLASIGKYAFYKCGRLEDIELPDTLMSIGSYAFYLTGLRSVTIPGSLTSFGLYAFGRCYALESVAVEDGVAAIGQYAFCQCEGLTQVTLPDSLTSIEESAFGSCNALREIFIPGSVNALGRGAFHGCGQLCRVTLQSGVREIGNEAFEYCKRLETLELPNTLTSIGRDAFLGSGLKYLTVPGSMTNIGYHAFNNAQNLLKLVLEPGVKTIDSAALSGCIHLETLALPYTVTSLTSNIFTDCTSIAKLQTGEDYYADKWFKRNKPEVTIEYLWGPVVATGITLDAQEVTLRRLSTKTLKATVISEYARNKKVVWTSSSPDQVSVNENGKIKAHRSSCTVLITATTEEGGYTATCRVTVPDAELNLTFIPRNGEDIFIRPIKLKTGAVLGDLPEAHKAGWTFDGWCPRGSEDCVSPDTPVGWPETNYMELLAKYTEGETLDAIEVFQGKDGPRTSTALPERFVEACGLEGAVAESLDPEVAAFSDGCIIAKAEGQTTFRATLADGGWTVLPVRVVMLSHELTMPAALKEIGSEAFLGNAQIEAVYLPDGAQTIGARAFAGCANLKLVSIPASVAAIADDAFDAAFTGTVLCKDGSAAQMWCRAHGIKHIAE